MTTIEQPAALAARPLERRVRRHPRFTIDDAQRAGDEWGFNCGPGALCAVLHLTPEELRPMMGDFERKGYTNPSLMLDVLKRCGAVFRQMYRSDEPGEMPRLQHGLIRVQWGGPWTKPGVPMAARYRQTHWIAMRDGGEVFDINAMCCGGWIPFREWHDQLAPWLCRQVVPKWDGRLWATHALDVTPNVKWTA